MGKRKYWMAGSLHNCSAAASSKTVSSCGPGQTNPARAETGINYRTGDPRVPAKRLKIVLYNPRAVFFTMPLALLAIGSELDPELYEVVTIDGRLETDPESAVLAHLDGALCLGVTVLTGAPIADALMISRAAKGARADLPVIWGGWHPS